jgi:hypothetical protein
MALNVSDVGENVALENFVNKTAPQNGVLRLYSNNITPSDTDTTATFTECTWTGYAAITLTGASWNTAAGGVITYSAQQTFTCSGAGSQSVYGYYVNQFTSTILMWAERDVSAPFTIANVGDAVKITPSISAN